MARVFLDHIVILLPHADVVNPPKWLTSYFTITPGGRHAGGQTDNKLICFQDGSYIELIAFVDDDPKHRIGHPWGDKSIGIIDFALITSDGAELNYEGMKKRFEDAGVGVKYELPAAGGRQRDDGKVLEWKVTVPEAPVKRGEMPFFCHDVTPRELRVPFMPESTQHKNGAYGIKQMVVYLPDERVNVLAKAYAALLDVLDPTADGESLERIFEIASLHRIENTAEPMIRIQGPVEDKQKKIVAEKGFMLGGLEIGGIDRVEWGF